MHRIISTFLAVSTICALSAQASQTEIDLSKIQEKLRIGVDVSYLGLHAPHQAWKDMQQKNKEAQPELELRKLPDTVMILGDPETEPRLRQMAEGVPLLKNIITVGAPAIWLSFAPEIQKLSKPLTLILVLKTEEISVEKKVGKPIDAVLTMNIGAQLLDAPRTKEEALQGALKLMLGVQPFAIVLPSLGIKEFSGPFHGHADFLEARDGFVFAATSGHGPVLNAEVFEPLRAMFDAAIDTMPGNEGEKDRKRYLAPYENKPSLKTNI